MTQARRVALCDANVLYPALLRDLLIRLNVAGLCQIHWTDRIQEEWIRNLCQEMGYDPAALERTRHLMEKALPRAKIHEAPFVEALPALPDPDDLHVLAAAVAGNVGVILTFNLRDFPASLVGQCGVQAVHPDDWLPAVLAQDESRSVEVIRRLLAPLRHPPLTLPDFAGSLERLHLPETARHIADYPI